MTYIRVYKCTDPACDQVHTKMYRTGQRSPSTKPCYKCGGTLKKAQPANRPAYRELTLKRGETQTIFGYPVKLVEDLPDISPPYTIVLGDLSLYSGRENEETPIT